MPLSPLKPCRHAGCRSLGIAGGYCEQHKGEQWQSVTASARANPAIALARRIRAGSQWRKVAALHKAQHPLCCDPFGVHGALAEAATSTHHVAPLAARPDLAFDGSNLASVCRYCHARVEAMERAGKQTAHLFAASI